MAEPSSGVVRHGNWFVLLDPAWQASTPGSAPPADVIVGGWMLGEDNILGPFQPNPHYVPGDEATPTDPVNAILRLIVDGADLADQLVALVRDTVVEIGCDKQDQLLMVEAVGGPRYALVVTADVHKCRVEAARWWPVLGSMLPEVVPRGAGILFNPGDPAQFRLAPEVLR